MLNYREIITIWMKIVIFEFLITLIQKLKLEEVLMIKKLLQLHILFSGAQKVQNSDKLDKIEHIILTKKTRFYLD